MPVIEASGQQVEKSQETKKHDFLEDFKRRSFNSTAAREAHQIAAANQSEFSKPRLRAFIQSNAALNALRYTDDEDI